MSKIIASIADAERFSNLQTIDGFYKSSNEIKQRATAARAERAEIVAGLRDAREAVAAWGSYADDYFKQKWDLAGDIAKLDSLLSRVGGGA